MTLQQTIFWAFPLLAFGGATYFHMRQNNGAWAGGPISWPKALWLTYAITSWYLVPLAHLASPDLSPEVSILLKAHLWSWWIRAPIELIMIYRFYNWTPKYGITHDALHIIMLVALAIFSLPSLGSEVGRAQLSRADSWALLWLGLTLVLLCFEITFAYLFLKIRGALDHKVYYASDDPIWRFINRLTWVAVSFGYFHLIIQAIFI